MALRGQFRLGNSLEIGEEPLKPMSYCIISPALTVAPSTNAVQSEVVEFVDRCWYVIEFDDGKFKK